MSPLTPVQRDIIEKCSLLTGFPSGDDVWYHYDDIRNRARLDAHKIGSLNRLKVLVHTVKTINEQGYLHPPSNVDILRSLRKVDSICGHGDPGGWTILDMIMCWVSEQLEWDRCVLLTIDGPSLSERSTEAMTSLLSMICSLGFWRGLGDAEDHEMNPTYEVSGY